LEKKITGRECRFVTHLPEIKGERVDTHVIKEVIHYEDGTMAPNLKIIENFERPFYITKKHFQNHKDKKEAELVTNVNKYEATESNLANAIAIRLGKNGYKRNQMRDVIDSPFLYGVDISSSAILKKMYMDKWPDIVTPFNVATFDIEVSLYTDEIIVITVATDTSIYTAVLHDLVKDIQFPIPKIMDLYKEYIPETRIKAMANVEVEIFNTEMEVIEAAFARVHRDKPDFLSIWNMDYDIPKIIAAIEKNGIDPADIFSDPDIPENLRFFKYKQGMKQHVTESGKVKPINVEEQWHSVITPASYYVIDAMCGYRQVRVGGKTVPGGFSLDNILDKELNLGKLQFGDDPKYKGRDWHMMMTRDKPLEYIVYNQWDCMSMCELDYKNKDLTAVVPLLAGVTDFGRFNSGPKKIVDALHYYFLDRGRVIGTKPRTVVDDKLLGLDNWIVTLPAYRLIDNGLCVVEEDPNMKTSIRGEVYDSDAVSSYPSNTQLCNVSKETTRREVTSIEGLEKEFFKKNNMNMFMGPTAAVDYCVNMFEFPSLTELDELVKDYI